MHTSQASVVAGSIEAAQAAEATAAGVTPLMAGPPQMAPYTSDGAYTSDTGATTEEEVMQQQEPSDEEEEEEEKLPLDPKTAREMAELCKINEESGAARAVLMEMERQRAESPRLDPRSSSRTPAADREPPYKTRYESSLFACECETGLCMRFGVPGRDLINSPQKHKTYMV